MEISNKKQIIKYDNSFNKTSLSLLTKVQSDILMSVLSAIRPKKDESDIIYYAEFSFSELRELVNSPNMHASRIKEVFDDLLNTQVEIFNDDKYIKANLFSHYELTSKNEAKIILSREMSNKLITKREEYTIIELDEYLELPSNYSKELYRLLRQFRHTGLLFIRRDDFRNVLKPPKSYNEYDFIRKVINPAIKANEVYFNRLKMPLQEPNTLPDVIRIQFEPHKKMKVKKKLKQSKGLQGEIFIDNGLENELIDYVKKFTL